MGLADEDATADLTRPETLRSALDGVYGVFANTNSFAGGDVDEVGQGQHLSLAGDRMSWNDIISTLNSQGHDLAHTRTPDDAWDGSFPGAREVRQMFNYFEAHTYFGPDAENKIAMADDVTTKPFTSFAKWAKSNMPPDR